MFNCCRGYSLKIDFIKVFFYKVVVPEGLLKYDKCIKPLRLSWLHQYLVYPTFRMSSLFRNLSDNLALLRQN